MTEAYRPHSADGIDRPSPKDLGKFTPSAQKALKFANFEADMLRHTYVGSEHLVLGLLHVPLSRVVFESFGVTLAKVRSSIEFTIGRGDVMVLGELGFTPRAREILAEAAREARRSQVHEIRDTDILYGLSVQGEGAGPVVLESLGVNLQRLARAARFVAEIPAETQALVERYYNSSSITDEEKIGMELTVLNRLRNDIQRNSYSANS